VRREGYKGEVIRTSVSTKGSKSASFRPETSGTDDLEVRDGESGKEGRVEANVPARKILSGLGGAQ